MIPDFNELVNGSSLSLPAHGRAGARATPFLAAFFAKRKTKFGGGKARAGKNSFPPTPFLFARPSEFFSEISVGIFAEKSSDFVQKSQPICKVCVSRLARGFAPRFGKRIFKQFPNEPILFSPEGRKQSGNFLPKSDIK
jgi:hypothetical protein